MAKYNLGGTVGESRVSSVILFGEQQSEAGGKKKLDKVKSRSAIGTKSVTSNKNWHKDVECNLCGKWMREDALKNHRGKKFCKAK